MKLRMDTRLRFKIPAIALVHAYKGMHGVCWMGQRCLPVNF